MAQGYECTILGFPVGDTQRLADRKSNDWWVLVAYLNINSCCSRGGMQVCSHLVNQGWRHSKDGMNFQDILKCVQAAHL